MQRHALFDIPVDTFDAREATALAKQMLQGSSFHHFMTLNSEILLRAFRDKAYADILGAADCALPDGIGLVWMGRLLGIPFKERIAGVDFMIALCGLAQRMGKSVFLLGGRGGAAEKTAEKLKQRFPKLIVRGWSEDTEMIPDADIVFVALGAPKQEEWIFTNKKIMRGVKIAMGVGGAFDMISGKTPRAPVCMRKIGLEWLWRLYLEPRKRFKRIVNAVIVFPMKVIYMNFHKSPVSNQKISNF